MDSLSNWTHFLLIKREIEEILWLTTYIELLQFHLSYVWDAVQMNLNKPTLHTSFNFSLTLYFPLHLHHSNILLDIHNLNSQCIQIIHIICITCMSHTSQNTKNNLAFISTSSIKSIRSSRLDVSYKIENIWLVSSNPSTHASCQDSINKKIWDMSVWTYNSSHITPKYLFNLCISSHLLGQHC